MKINIKTLSLLIFVLPIFVVFLSYFLSIILNLVPPCIPNFDGCTSISRVGRYPPVSYVFKPLMFISGILILLYWKINYSLISKNKPFELIKFAYFLGILGVIFLFLYIIFLGESNYYRFFRKIGIFIFIFFTVISELLLSISLYRNQNKINFLLPSYVNLKIFFNIFLSILGFSLFPIVITKIVQFPNLKNAISWNYFLLIQINFLISFFCWNPKIKKIKFLFY